MSNVTQTISNLEPLAVKVVTSHVPKAKEEARIDGSQSTEESCPQCGHSQQGLSENWCKKCGFYPKLAIKLELEDYDLEEEKAAKEEAPPPTLFTAIPRWVILLLAGVVVLGVESLACHFLYKPDSWPRTRWSLIQLFSGLGLFLVFHSWVFAREAMKSGKIAVIDFFLNPYSVWEDVLGDAKNHGWKIAFAGHGLAAMLLSVLIIGSIPYGEVFNWGFKPRPKKNLANQIAMAMPEGEEMSLEEAIEKMAGVAEGVAAKEEEKKEEAPKKMIECVVIGYATRNESKPELSTLFLASDYRGTLQYTGSVSTDVLDPKVRRDLLKKLQKLRRDYPVVKASATADWVNPVVACKVQCAGYTDKGRLIEPLLEELMADLKWGK